MRASVPQHRSTDLPKTGSGEVSRAMGRGREARNERDVNRPMIRPGRHLSQAPVHAPNAALLIDFDNVTLGVQKDLTKELRTLLNSDIIKGKVAVQRAYADWRRYPQYIVSLSESSIDLIFAPAFGSTKKNATDIRLAIDAIELVFTRPEIGTFILLSGDSDFSTMVIKLKEYGKYVIGVGIRESASDLLIQNCDEYYSYNDLAGLTKEVDTPSIQRDPWELAGQAVAQMARNGDVMRSDRLKQVMQQIDPNFDERNAGFNRFSKFVLEAGQRGVVTVTKLDNGQFEVGPGAAAVAPPATAPAPLPGRPREVELRDGREDGGRGRRGRRGRGRLQGVVGCPWDVLGACVQVGVVGLGCAIDVHSGAVPLFPAAPRGRDHTQWAQVRSPRIWRCATLHRGRCCARTRTRSSNRVSPSSTPTTTWATSSGRGATTGWSGQ